MKKFIEDGDMKEFDKIMNDNTKCICEIADMVIKPFNNRCSSCGRILK